MRRVVVALAMSGVVLSGCGTSGGPGQPTAAPSTAAATGAEPAPAPGALVAASYGKMTEARTAKLDLSFRLTAGSVGDASGADIRFGGSGVQDFVGKRAALTVEDPGGQRIEQRLIGTTMYIKVPEQAKGSPALAGKTWLKTDLEKAAQSAGIGSSGAGTGGDPSQMLQMLGSVSNEVTEVAREDVRGVGTTHYRAVVDLTKASTQQGNTPAEAARLKQLLGTSTMPVDVWVDGEGLARRMQFQMPVPKAAAGQSGMRDAKMMATVEYSDFGTPVDVQEPPATQTADASALGSGGSGSGGSGSGSSGGGATASRSGTTPA